jgi:hypothetical protein
MRRHPLPQQGRDLGRRVGILAWEDLAAMKQGDRVPQIAYIEANSPT